MRHRFLAEAALEYEQAVEFYERAQAGLGERLSNEIDEALAVTLELPEMGAPVRDTPPELGVRRRVLRRFSVEIDYVVRNDELIIVAVFQTKRRPGYWLDRLGKLG